MNIARISCSLEYVSNNVLYKCPILQAACPFQATDTEADEMRFIYHD